MAKIFNDLIGVVGTDKDNNVCYNFPPNEEYKITSVGDNIFKVNVENMTVERYNVKFRYKPYYSGPFRLYVCKADQFRNILPYDGRDRRRGNSNLHLFDMIDVKTNVNHYGLFFLKLKDATKCLENIRNKKIFKELKNGDTVFLVDKKNASIKKLIVNGIEIYNKYYFIMSFDNGQQLKFSIEGMYDKNISYFSLEYFSFGKFDDCYRFYSFHIDEKDAEKALNKYIKNKEAIDKKKLKIAEENKNGTPINRKDCKGNELHVGDKVVYIRPKYDICNGAQTLGLGVIVSASGKAKIKIFDEEEKNSKIEKRWSREGEFYDGCHILTPLSVMLDKKD